MVKYKIEKDYSMIAEKISHRVFRGKTYFFGLFISWEFMDFRYTKEKAEALISLLKKELDA